MALIAVSIAVHSAEHVSAAISRAVRAAEIGADIVEWRIDELATAPDPLAHVQRLVHESPLPCIVTCRSRVEGGDYEGSERNRLAILLKIVADEHPPRYIDVERSAFESDAEFRGRLRHQLEQASHNDRGTSLILSVHDVTQRPRDLIQKIEAMANEPLCSIIKVAWQARSLRDNLEAFEFLKARPKPMIALCMGQFGLMSRVLAGKFGGFLTFAGDSPQTVTAPGQPTIEELKKLYRFDRIAKHTKVYGVIGWPVDHSLSPRVHNAGFQMIGHDGVYLSLPIPPEYEHFKATVGAMIDFTGLDFRGASVTIPHKENLVRFVKERGGRLDALSGRIGAANTLIIGSAGGMECVNTDGPAALQALCEGVHIHVSELSQLRIAMLGAGGVARSIAGALLDEGASLTIFNRTKSRGMQLVADLGCGFAHAKDRITVGDLDALQQARFDVYINCTSLGMSDGAAPDQSPLPEEALLDERVTVMDTVYVPPRTPLIQQAEARGARVLPGMEMFIKQAALQFEQWTAVPAPELAFRAAMREGTQAGPVT
jgi:3-dehydroquinate dehydratase/shikimate dehydrogenase